VRSSRAFLANPTWLDPEVEAATGYMALGRGVEARCADPQARGFRMRLPLR